MPLNFVPASSFHAKVGGCEIRAYNDGNVLPFSVMLQVASLFLECVRGSKVLWFTKIASDDWNNATRVALQVPEDDFSSWARGRILESKQKGHCFSRLQQCSCSGLTRRSAAFVLWHCASTVASGPFFLSFSPLPFSSDFFRYQHSLDSVCFAHEVSAVFVLQRCRLASAFSTILASQLACPLAFVQLDMWFLSTARHLWLQCAHVSVILPSCSPHPWEQPF